MKKFYLNASNSAAEKSPSHLVAQQWTVARKKALNSRDELESGRFVGLIRLYLRPDICCLEIITLVIQFSFKKVNENSCPPQRREVCDPFYGASRLYREVCKSDLATHRMVKDEPTPAYERDPERGG